MHDGGVLRVNHPFRFQFFCRLERFSFLFLLHSRRMHFFLARCTSNHVPGGGLRGKISLSSTFLSFDRSSLFVASFLMFYLQHLETKINS